ncbi:rCG55274 [Rattus norvegicus]|uniref:RCG55274 n=1 Tax=Rattus norvegicus TaxID=10116 RepID=A6J824_RAT|nr:rCG55274 [Rattus norvegicus]
MKNVILTMRYLPILEQELSLQLLFSIGIIRDS